ncbi:tRNA uridine-5-carboxymethylaminomethyl(34) synthesis GTPase MnmE [Amedibacterium intestinale]|uniref:tRNA uridine-5-carboxymethylaminomethyl(34) synthesis GTPase MnmE n=1 Tax=Amedibacterium intestinale TaxID=2583452 RepID=UPI000E204DF3
MLKDTIAAISTAAVDGAISIVRLSGDDAIEIANSIASINLLNKKSHTISYGFIIDPITSQEIDEVLFCVFKAPKTFTREDVVEINCHGGRFVTKKILSLCLMQGARLAEPGEFTRRAFLNGRIDLTQAEAINDMILADSNENMKLAIHGIKGSVKKLLDPLLENILDIIANIEVNIDYPEYDDVEMLTNDVVLPKAKAWLDSIDTILDRAQSGKIMKEGIRTAIVGKPNVGKSSLLNALLEEDKAIVTDIAGTTRDIVEGHIHLGGLTLNLIDTAGIRDTEDVVEKIGIQRSLQAMEDAQLVIVVLDGSRPLDEQDDELLEMTKEKTRIVVYNKNDLYEAVDGISISAAKQEITPLVNKIHELFDHHKIAIEEPVLGNERQIGFMMKAKQSMLQAVEAMENGLELDLVEIDIQDAYTALKEILGEVHREDLLDTLFSNFCLGK